MKIKNYKIKNYKIKSGHFLTLTAGIVLASATAIAYAQNTPTTPETPIATAMAAPPDPFITQAVHDLSAFCSQLQTTSPVPTSPETSATDPATQSSSLNQTNATPQPTTAQNTDSSSSETPANPIPTDPCANFHASFISTSPSAIAEPQTEDQAEPSWLDRLTHLFWHDQPVVSQAAPLPPPPAVAEGLQIQQMARLAKVPILMYHDIVAKKEVFFDVTPEELEEHFKYLQSQGITPISPDALLAHLKTGVPLPNKPVLISFDDGYGGHYQYVLPLLQKYRYPALFSIYINKMKGKTGRTSVTWEQLKEMAASPLVTIASHSVSHPKDLRELTDDQLAEEIIQSKRILEQNLGIPIHYFTYPEGKYDARVKQWAIAAGYKAAFSMNDLDEQYAGESPDVMSIGRFGQSRIRDVVPEVWGGYPAPVAANVFNFGTNIEKRDFVINKIPFTLISGGRPSTIHADSRYQVPEILARTGAVAGVDGGFFSLKYLNSNTMIGPVMSLSKGFVPGNNSENPRLNGRPLVLISSQQARFIPFDATKHNTFAGITAEAQQGEIITDAFVGAAWLVRDSKPQPAETFANLYSFDANRNRAFWGINQAGQPVIGVSHGMIDSVSLGQALAQMGYRDAIMVDSGASTSLAFLGQSMMKYTPRPVPHVVALFPPVPSTKP